MLGLCWVIPPRMPGGCSTLHLPASFACWYNRHSDTMAPEDIQSAGEGRTLAHYLTYPKGNSCWAFIADVTDAGVSENVT